MLIRSPMAWRRLFRVGIVTPFAVLAMAAPAHASTLAVHELGAAPTVVARQLGSTYQIGRAHV